MILGHKRGSHLTVKSHAVSLALASPGTGTAPSLKAITRRERAIKTIRVLALTTPRTALRHRQPTACKASSSDRTSAYWPRQRA